MLAPLLAVARSPLASALALALFAGALGIHLRGLALQRTLPFLLPLWGLYLAAGLASGVPHAAGIVDAPLLGTDGQRFLHLARLWGVEGRHAGWSLLLFPVHAAQALGERFGLADLGRVFLHAEMAAFGVLTVAGLEVLLRPRLRSLVARLLVVHAFGLALAPWALAASIDTYVVSAAFTVLFWIEAERVLDGRRRGPGTLVALQVLLLGISLENAIVAVVWAIAWPCLRPGRRSVRAALVFLGVGAASVALAAGLATRTPDFARLNPEGLVGQHVARHGSLTTMASPERFAGVGYVLLVASVVAQPERPIRTYSAGLQAPGPRTVLFAIWLGALVGLLVTGRARRPVRGPPGLGGFLTGLLAARHLFLMGWAPAETSLFVLPSLAILVFALGTGWGRLTGARRRLCAALVVLLDVGLLLASGSYLVRALEAV